MTFLGWFESAWMKPGERRTPAMIRLAAHAGVAIPTLKRALDGAAVRPATAETLAAVTAGAVTREAIVFGSTPTRSATAA